MRSQTLTFVLKSPIYVCIKWSEVRPNMLEFLGSQISCSNVNIDKIANLMLSCENPDV